MSDFSMSICKTLHLFLKKKSVSDSFCQENEQVKNKLSLKITVLNISFWQACLKEVWPREMRVHPENFITTEDFRPSTKEEADRRVTRRHATLDAGLVPDAPGLRGWERSELNKTCLNEEAKMVKCLAIMQRSVKKQDRESGRNVKKAGKILEERKRCLAKALGWKTYRIWDF